MAAESKGNVWENSTLCVFAGLARDSQCLARDLSVLVTSVGVHDDFDSPSFHSDLDALTGILASGAAAQAIRDALTDDDRAVLRDMKPVYTLLAHRFFLDFQSDDDAARSALASARVLLDQCRAIVSRLFAALGSVDNV
ncbi:hypothetical protein HEQ72_09285 [Haematospirillum sp. 15-248]|uniref:hypothetical protein n=1 Tax=Haematospirillum sp. 15-248 TaxID=2723107 RepID=UPI001438EBB4|nr:hypothetical protein [Haematospirillum sp. 15-248]NKD88499.1 hypothetical protein [Haematospirillum sp. 15-248]